MKGGFGTLLIRLRGHGSGTLCIKLINYISEVISKSSLGRPVLFLLLFTLIAFLITPRFLSVANIKAIFIAASPLMILAVGETLVVLTGMIDLGVESIAASAGVLLAYLDIIVRMPTIAELIVVMLYGLLVGLLAGLLVTKARIPSFIVSLGTYWGLRGVGMIIGGGLPISPASVVPSRPLSFSWIAGQIGPVPVMPIIAVFIVLFFHFFISQSQMGVHIYATGGDEVAAKSRGVKTDRVKIFVFAMSGLTAAIAGIVLTAWLNSGYAWSAQGYSLQAVAAIVLGGIPFTGGYGSVVGAAIGAVIVTMISNLITLMGISPFYNYIAVAVIITLAGLQIKRSGVVK